MDFSTASLCQSGITDHHICVGGKGWQRCDSQLRILLCLHEKRIPHQMIDGNDSILNWLCAFGTAFVPQKHIIFSQGCIGLVSARQAGRHQVHRMWLRLQSTSGSVLQDPINPGCYAAQSSCISYKVLGTQHA